MLERALRDIHFNPDSKKSAKQQALEVRAAGTAAHQLGTALWGLVDGTCCMRSLAPVLWLTFGTVALHFLGTQ
jgi:hypothetical protein